MDPMKQFEQVIERLDRDQIHDAFDLLRDRSKFLRDQQDFEARGKIKPGATVSFTGRRGMTLTGTVKRINVVKAIVEVAPPYGGPPVNWSVHLGSLTVVEGESKPRRKRA